MKYEWKKQDKEFYLPKANPEKREIPAFTFLTFDGEGNPNSPAFTEAVGGLYSLSYTLKMLPKKGVTPEGYYDYAIFPLEGLWTTSESFEVLDKDKLIYKIMIRQPDFLTPDLFLDIKDRAKKKVPAPILDKLKLETITDGLSVQMLHIGSFDEESTSFDKMKIFCQEHRLNRTSFWHREIYLTDPRKGDAAKQKTVLRYFVSE